MPSRAAVPTVRTCAPAERSSTITRSVCKGRERCHRRAGCRPSAYGQIVRSPLAHDRRIFTLTPYGSPSRRRGYRRRDALKRIYRCIDHDFGFERQFVRGQARTSLAVAVMMAMARGRVRADRPGQMRPLVGVILDTG